MGEYADYILSGDDCQVCGVHIGNGDGYPRSCPHCSIEKKTKKDKKRIKRRKKYYAKKKTKELRVDAADPTGWTQHTRWHWQKTLCGLRFDYWPSVNKAMFNRIVYSNVDNIKELEKTLVENFGK